MIKRHAYELIIMSGKTVGNIWESCRPCRGSRTCIGEGERSGKLNLGILCL